MAKVGFWLKGASGKLAGSVLSTTSGGETTVRENVAPSNPNTEKQIDQRARFKLISQIAANVSNSIAIPRKNGMTPRNQFVTINMPYVSSVNGQASAIIPNLQFTDSTRSMQGVNAVRNEDHQRVYINSSLENKALSRVIYMVFAKINGSLVAVDSKIVNKSNDLTFQTDIELPTNYDLYIYAFGAIDTSRGATAKYENMNIQTGEDFAALLFSRQLSLSDMVLTRTRGVELRHGEHATLSVPAGYAGIYLSARPSWLRQYGQFNITIDGEEEVHHESFAAPIGKSIHVEWVPAVGSTAVLDYVLEVQKGERYTAPFNMRVDETVDLVAYYHLEWD